MEPTRLDGFSEGRGEAGTRRLQQPDCSSIHPFTHPHHHPFQPTQRAEAHMLGQKAAVPTVHDEFQPRCLCGDHCGQKGQQDEGLHLPGERGAPRKPCLAQLRLSHSRRWSLPEMVLPRFCCRSRSARPRVCAAGTGLEMSGCQAPPRKQEARGSGDVHQGRDGQQWDCSANPAELTVEGGWCTRVIPVADNQR